MQTDINNIRQRFVTEGLPALSYDSVYLLPNLGILPTRAVGDTSVEFCGHKFNLPVIPANMKDVIAPSNALWLANHGYFYIMHRFDTLERRIEIVQQMNSMQLNTISISVGLRDEYFLEEIKRNKYRVDFITIDIAHAHHEKVVPTIKLIREHFPKTKLIVGNVATFDGIEFLYNQGVDAIKVGIGGGSICSTKHKTGFHAPTLQSVFDGCIFNEMCQRKEMPEIPIIADGGAKQYGDIAKALTFGATMVMSGSWFASCSDSPALLVGDEKVYRGSTSYEMKGENKHIEGRTLSVALGMTYLERVVEITQALQSSISYAGGKDLSAFKSVKYIRVFPE